MMNSTNEKPKPITTALPAGLEILRGAQCWAGQEYTDTGDKLEKTPKSRSGITTGVNRPQDLGTYDEIAAMCRRSGFTGMALHTGYEIKPGIVLQAKDLDKVRNPETGEITPAAAEIVAEMNSYTEISESGTGLHIVYLARPDANMKNKNKADGVLGAGTRLEIFTKDQFCGITGNVYGGYNTIGLRDQESKAVYLRYFEYAAIDQAQAETEKKRVADGTPASREQIERLKGNIADYLQRNGLPTKKRFRCLNPAHEDRHPSMSYYAKGKCCHCFACGVNYDIFAVAGVLENLPTFPEQLQYIASLYGEEVEPYRPDPDPKQDPAPEPLPITNIYEYITGGQFAADIESFQRSAEVKTGFSLLDEKIGGGLYVGLYVLGAVPTLGKTTYALQLADQIAEQHRHVLFFSLEQSRLELVSKSISRMARELYPGDQRELKTSLQIRKGYTSEEVNHAQQIYTEAAARYITIVEGDFKTTAEMIRTTAEQFIKENDETPIIIIDYLQILRPEAGSRTSDQRLTTELNITALRQMARDLSTPVMVISSFNRTNYMQTVDYESFKETGGIEYTADVLLGMEYEVISTLDGKNTTANRETVSQAKESAERKIRLKCLKNRYGQSYFEIPMKYYPRYDYFIEDQDRRRKMFEGVPMR